MIVHLDGDAFFASVEQAADPKLRGKPVAVGGDRRGIIASASYEARKLGIYTPMPTARTRKVCPRLIFEKYEQFSRFMFSYAYDSVPMRGLVPAPMRAVPHLPARNSHRTRGNASQANNPKHVCHIHSVFAARHGET